MEEKPELLALITTATWPGFGALQKMMSPGSGTAVVVLAIFVKVTLPYFVDVFDVEFAAAVYIAYAFPVKPWGYGMPSAVSI